MEPDHRGEVGVDHGERRVESKELAGEEGESSRPPRRAAPLPWRGIGSRIVRKERSSSSSSSELSCCGDDGGSLWDDIWDVGAATRMAGPEKRVAPVALHCDEDNLGRRQKDLVSPVEVLAARDMMRLY